MSLKLNVLKDSFLKLSLNTKLIVMMLFLSLSLMTVLIFLYYQTEKAIYKEFEQRTAELSKAIQVGVEEVTSNAMTDEKRLQNYLKKLNTKGVKELSIISNTDKIISSTDPKNIGKWVTRSKKDLIFKAELGEPVTGEGHAYNVIIPVTAYNQHYGYIHLTINTEDFSSFMRLRIIKRIIASAGVFAIGIIMAIFLARSYTKPIKEFVTRAQRVASGNLDQEMHTDRKDEIGELARSFTYMIEKLKEQRELEERLRKAEHLAGIGQFSRSIAHEIRNPLNFINLSIDHIKEKYKPANTKDAENFNSLISNIKKEVMRVSRFAESFLEYGRPLELNLQETDIETLIADVIDLVTAKANQDNIEIIKEYNFLPILKIDPEFIKTCLYNIILNSFQAMPDGGKIIIRTKKADNRFCLSVEDTGIGVPEDKISRIFDPFFTTKINGLGLGMALTKRVIEEHRGKIEFKSMERIGSTVTILLPLNQEV